MNNALMASRHPCYVARGGYLCDCGESSQSIEDHRLHLWQSPACILNNATMRDIEFVTSRTVKPPLYLLLNWRWGQKYDEIVRGIVSTRDYEIKSCDIHILPCAKFTNRAGGWFRDIPFTVKQFVPFNHARIMWRSPENAVKTGVLSPDGSMFYECGFGEHGILIEQLESDGIELTGWLRIGGDCSYFLD